MHIKTVKDRSKSTHSSTRGAAIRSGSEPQMSRATHLPVSRTVHCSASALTSSTGRCGTTSKTFVGMLFDCPGSSRTSKGR